MLKQPKESLNKAYRRQKVDRSTIELFRKNLSHLLKELDEQESEEHLKNDVISFLNDTWYKGIHLINTKGRTDLVIHNDKTAKSTAGVLLEVKKPGNKGEMVSKSNLNAKSLQELLLYYLREKHELGNGEIKHLVVTNVYEWFIFDANQFFKLFFQNKQLEKSFKEWSAGHLESTDTSYFYKEIASLHIDTVKDQLEYTWFDLREFEKELKKGEDSRKLIALFKILSPVHLLKQSFANDSNSLNKQFYHELLHIIGLEEVKEKGKKVIQRKEQGKRNEGALLENAMYIMDERDRLYELEKPSNFGNTKEDQLYNVGLELCITWVNRILFLKLLESQLVAYHKGDNSFKFLNAATIQNYDSLESLFFGVLARRHDERNDRLKDKFAKVPYLNSSLFESTEMERKVLTVTQLNNNLDLQLYSQTVLKNESGKRQTGKKDTLAYLFEFLDAYDFSSEGKEEIQDESKSLINASVLGLIFEKINGYKDGSFYTPGFITMYMCRETIRRSVIQKFNEVKGWSISEFDQLYDKIEDKKEANEIINSIKICDPAVGSGHFLVSALNELIAIKSELKILMDKNGKTLRDYHITIENDELIITDEDGDLFQYVSTSAEKQRVQETLFHEKQTIIENCLFGVDINPNSVKICRLRLWIELLKNAYYKNETELETLPNIDINIKCGNSLISRFSLDADLKDALAGSKWNISTYKDAVDNYKNASSKEDKREFESLINTIKSDFQSRIDTPLKADLRKARGQLDKQLTDLNTKKQWGEKIPADLKKKVANAEAKLLKLIENRDDIESNKIYEDAFEWRFEFPEVLNNEGQFVGFDIVIGNPPYVQLQSIKETSKQLQQFNYDTYTSMGDLYALFYERGNEILAAKSTLCYITGSAWMRTNYGQSLRSYLNKRTNLLEVIDLSDCEIFDSATVLTCIITFSKESENRNPIRAIRFTRKDQEKLKNLKTEISSNHTVISKFPDSSWIILPPESSELKCKVEGQGIPLVNWKININRGILTGFNDAFVINEETKSRLISEDPRSELLIQPLLRGRDVHKYYYENSALFLIGTFPSLNINIDEFPSIREHLKSFRPKLNQTGEIFINDKGKKEKSRKKTNGEWFETQDSIAYWRDFKEPKIIYPNMTKFLPFSLDLDGNFLNDKCFILTGEKLYFLVAFLNSKLFRFCFADAFPELQGNSKEVKKFILETIPVKDIDDEQQYVEKVTNVLELKKRGQFSEAGKIENEIDHLIYSHYQLNDKEIAIVEGGEG